jgi:hypothetical protein
MERSHPAVTCDTDCTTKRMRNTFKSEGSSAEWGAGRMAGPS